MVERFKMGLTTVQEIERAIGALEHFHFYYEQDRAAKCGFS
jgi:hypothetical protein